ncbi:MAG: sigma-70 family RNA polymerase sigma factor [Lachnospiraceae bacterium]|nr:sigma-70 family RNA polymerase sigma factor [Lachnospiraceae bacterium]
MESEAIKIDEYLGCDTDKRFTFLYENYSVMRPIIKDYREDLISDVYDMKTYNRRAANGELGVRIQVSRGRSSPTEKEGISHLTIAKAIDEGYLDEDFFEDTDDPKDLIRRVTVYHLVRKDFETFSSKLGTLDPTEQRILKPYLLREKSMSDLAEEMGVDYRSAVKRVYRIRKRLSEIVEPRLRKEYGYGA